MVLQVVSRTFRKLELLVLGIDIYRYMNFL